MTNRLYVHRKSYGHTPEKLYIAYGSNLCVSQMITRCPDAEIVGTGYIANNDMRYYGCPGHGVASLIPCNGKCVPVGIWKISEADEESLDRYEGYPHLYRKEIVRVITDEGISTKGTGTSVEGMVYIMNNYYHGTSNVECAPSEAYLQTILTGYKNFRLPTEFLKSTIEGYGHALEKFFD